MRILGNLVYATLLIVVATVALAVDIPLHVLSTIKTSGRELVRALKEAWL